MKRPLYKLAGEPSFDPAKSHCGLWFDKFCNQWCRDDEKTGLTGWSLKAFSAGHGTDRKDFNPKLDWICTITGSRAGEPKLLAEYSTRFAHLASALGGQSLIFKTTNRFATGLGREHPTENGFAWHPVLGTPYLPGSSVKGLVRAWIESGWNEETIDPTRFHRVFGSDYRNGSADPRPERDLKSQSGSVIFFDAIPSGPIKLEADVMTPHYGDYYEGNKDQSDNAIPPADWLRPNPIPFLSVAAGQLFQFALAPRTLAIQHCDDCSAAAQWLEQALEWLGAGAKTAVGYGRFVHDEGATSRLERELEEQQKKHEQERARREATKGMSPIGGELYRDIESGGWRSDKSRFLAAGGLDAWLERLEADPEPDAVKLLCDLLEAHDPGILADPDATEGKKQKPKFKERPRMIARRLLAMSSQQP